MSAALSFRDVATTSRTAEFSCDIEEGESVLMLTAGAPESEELARMAAGLCPPTRGAVLVGGRDVAGLCREDILHLRRRIAVVPSQGGLVSNLKLWENIMLPLLYHAGGVTEDAERRALHVLAELGYTGRAMAMPAHLTPWERRAAALARALLTSPGIIIYCNCIDDAEPPLRGAFCRIAADFHAGGGRTSVYLSSSPDLSGEFPVDRIVRLREQRGADSRDP